MRLTPALLPLALLLAAAPLPAQRIRLPVKLAELEQRVKVDSNDAAAHYNVALGYWNEKRFDDAERALKMAVTIEPRFAPAHLALAYLPFARRPKLWNEIWDNAVPEDQVPLLKRADSEYRHAFLIDPLVDLKILAVATPPKPNFVDVNNYYGEIWALYFQGFADCQEGKYEDCHGRFAALIREIDGDRFGERIPASVHWYKGIAAAHVGKNDIAERHFRILLALGDEEVKERERKGDLTRVPLQANEFRYTLATILQAAGRTSEAIAMFKEVLNNDVGFYMANVRLANIYEAARDYPRAVQERLNAVNVNPDDASLLTDLGVTLGKAGMMPQAETRLQAAADANPRDTRSLYWLGVAQQELGKTAEARAAFTRFVELAPSRYQPQVALAKDRLARLQ
ncbi:MAG: tetratricopeptide repeat protein [Gemmatimonadetes bacterium]|nr:tetratricopeptide repeat protein [Gemmatimonadota bacterium]